jgi:hypothetical protein
MAEFSGFLIAIGVLLLLLLAYNAYKKPCHHGNHVRVKMYDLPHHYHDVQKTEYDLSHPSRGHDRGESENADSMNDLSVSVRKYAEQPGFQQEYMLNWSGLQSHPESDLNNHTLHAGKEMESTNHQVQKQKKQQINKSVPTQKSLLVTSIFETDRI